jgi:hypothetical protein
MAAGAHPSGEGILQTFGPTPGMVLFGPTYNRELCLAGFDVGLALLTNYLPKLLVRVKPETAILIDDWTALKADVAAWRTAHETELRANEPAGRISLPQIPEPTLEDVHRCWKLIRARERSMTRLRVPPATTH